MNSTSDNFYTLLEVPETASSSQIRTAYIKQSLFWHPDKNPSPEATVMFQRVSEAYYVLCDSERRNAYNASIKEKKAFTLEKIDSNQIFGSIFDDLMIPEVPNPAYFWEPIGAASGAMLGFIIFNIPGSIAGYYFGKSSGKIRDMKGKCVYEAFQSLSGDKRKEILKGIASKFFTSAITK